MYLCRAFEKGIFLDIKYIDNEKDVSTFEKEAEE